MILAPKFTTPYNMWNMCSPPRDCFYSSQQWFKDSSASSMLWRVLLSRIEAITSFHVKPDGSAHFEGAYVYRPCVSRAAPLNSINNRDLRALPNIKGPKTSFSRIDECTRNVALRRGIECLLYAWRFQYVMTMTTTNARSSVSAILCFITYVKRSDSYEGEE